MALDLPIQDFPGPTILNSISRSGLREAGKKCYNRFLFFVIPDSPVLIYLIPFHRFPLYLIPVLHVIIVSVIPGSLHLEICLATQTFILLNRPLGLI